MARRNSILSVVLLAATIVPTQFNQSSAESLVKTQAQCTRYGGRVERDAMGTLASHPWICHTPAKDRQCEKQFGKRGYFDAEFGKCKKMTQEEYECYIFDDCW